jgi:hypothetical protein
MHSALDVSISYFTSHLAFLKVQNTNETNTQKTCGKYLANPLPYHCKSSSRLVILDNNQRETRTNTAVVNGYSDHR